MTGLELARCYYNACRPVLFEFMPDIMAQAAAGLVGEGSECFSCDDQTSRDHDFGAAFCLWLPASILQAHRKRIEKTFAQLPTEFAGFPSRLSPHLRQGRVGPISLENFYRFFTGLTKPPSSWREWMSIPEYQLAAAINGEVFEDGLGVFSQWRDKLLSYYPRDVWLKKLASKAMLAAQAGQYNLPRALHRGDGPAAMLAACRFAENAISLVFLLNRHYTPFYKWAPKLGRIQPLFGDMLGNTLDAMSAQPLRGEQDIQALKPVENFCACIAKHFQAIGLSNEQDSWLWAHGAQIMAHVENAEIRRLNLLHD